MINSAEEFKYLRESEYHDEYNRAAQESAAEEVWHDVLRKFPELSFWVANNKTVPVEILEELTLNDDSRVREMVARKRKLSRAGMERLISDPDESVRLALARNAKLPRDLLVRMADDPWIEIRRVVQDRLDR